MIGEGSVGVSLEWSVEMMFDGHGWVSLGFVGCGWVMSGVVGCCLGMCGFVGYSEEEMVVTVECWEEEEEEVWVD